MRQPCPGNRHDNSSKRSDGAQLLEQSKSVCQHPAAEHLAGLKVKDGHAGISNRLSCRCDIEHCPLMCSRVREEGNDFIAFSNEIIYLIMKVRESCANRLHILFEAF